MRILLIISILSLSLTASGQNERKFVRNGNKLYEEALKDTVRLDTAKFSQAETEYRKALNKKPGNEKWEFNLANAIYKQMRFDEAEQKFETLNEKMETPEEKARSLHNLGNSQLLQEKIDESIESYKKALRHKPDDLETKYNLAYAQMLKKQQEEQQNQNQQNQNKEQNQDQNQDQQQNQQNQDQQDQNEQQDKQNQQQNQQQQNQDQQQQQSPQNKISRQDAEQLLQALQNDEKDIQDKVKKEKAAKARKSKVEKEW